jgi:hypothetical protein
VTTVSISVLALLILVTIYLIRSGRVGLFVALACFLTGFLTATTSAAPAIDHLIDDTTSTTNSVTHTAGR